MGEQTPTSKTESVDQHQRTQKKTTLQHTLSSQCGSAVSTIILYPVDVVRMRYMSQDGTQYRQHNGLTYGSVRRSFEVIYKEEGIRSFYRGVHVSVMGSVLAWGVYMGFYRLLCDWYRSFGEHGLIGDYSSGLDTFFQRSGLSIIASSASAVICTPIWLLKTRMQLEEVSARSAAGSGVRHFQSFRSGLMHSVRTNGVRSLWRGLSAQVLLGIPNAFNLPLYETFKHYLRFYSGNDNLSVAQVVACSTVSKVVLTFFSHPIAVVKTRLQDYRARAGTVQYRYFMSSVQSVWKRHGINGFYRGMIPSLLQTVPRSVLMFVFYEQFLSLFSGLGT